MNDRVNEAVKSDVFANDLLELNDDYITQLAELQDKHDIGGVSDIMIFVSWKYQLMLMANTQEDALEFVQGFQKYIEISAEKGTLDVLHESEDIHSENNNS